MRAHVASEEFPPHPELNGIQIARPRLGLPGVVEDAALILAVQVDGIREGVPRRVEKEDLLFEQRVHRGLVPPTKPCRRCGNHPQQFIFRVGASPGHEVDDHDAGVEVARVAAIAIEGIILSQARDRWVGNRGHDAILQRRFPQRLDVRRDELNYELSFDQGGSSSIGPTTNRR